MKKITNILSVSFVLFCIKTIADTSVAYYKQNSKKAIKIFTLFCFILLLSVFSANKIYGQETFVNKVYLQTGAGGTTNGFISEVGIQAILKKNWSATITYQKIEYMTPKKPSDYIPETIQMSTYSPPLHTDLPTTNMNTFSLTAGKIFPVGRKIWFTTEAGFSIINGEKLTFKPSDRITRSIQTTSFSVNFFSYAQSLPIIYNYTSISSNYTISVKNKTEIGGMLRADVNWAFSSFMGIGAGVFANFNSIQSPVGYNVKLIVGWMNRGKKEKN